MELEGNSNSGTSVAFLTKLKEKHPGPLRVIWGQCARPTVGRRCGSTSGRLELELRLVNLRATAPDFNAGRGYLGLGERGGHWQSVPGEQGGGAEPAPA